MKKTAIFIIITAIAINLCVPFYADSGETYTSAIEASAELNLTSKSCVLMESTTGKILFENNKDDHLPPASVTKVMTMLLILEAVESGRIS
ncbi:MAG: D-alanyl-D-alanine carboxypeptidase, partial [Clostridia bacterium]|nr:D-alanyl-D-alanine carboxypeptidase [Clostridia bacterium]